MIQYQVDGTTVRALIQR